MRFLDGVRVVDLSRLLPGPACTWYLQGLGATVVKVEEPEGGDYLRYIPPYGEDGIGAWYSAINAGKRSVALDLRDPRAREALLAMLARADVLVESFRPGVMARLGLAPADLLRRFPRLVVASITGYGQEGPWRDRPGHDLGYLGVAGCLALGHRRGGVPDLPGIQVADIAGGALTAALQVAAALFARERTGEGALLDVSMTESVLPFVAPAFAEQALGGRSPPPGASVLTGGMAAYGLYLCADDKVAALAAIEPKFQAAFHAATGVLPLDADAVARLFRTRPRDEWVELLGDACVTPVLELDELASFEVHAARGSFAGEGQRARVRPPFSGAEAAALLPCARLGEHTAEELLAAGVDPAPFTEQPT